MRNVDKIIKIQARYRGYNARKYIGMLKSQQIGSSKYFTYEESKETVTKNIYDPSAKREKRAPYVFKTGAIYVGEWKGGFRDGFGE